MKRMLLVLAMGLALAAFSFAQQDAAGGAASQLPPEQAQGQAPLIMGYEVAPVPAGEDIANYPYNSSLGYKGVITGNFDYYDANDELLVDFGSSGVWYYNAGSWHQESGLNPDSMISVDVLVHGDEEAVFDFGSVGLWEWNEGYWEQLSGVNAQGMFATDDDEDTYSEIQVDFGTLGVWRYDWDDSSWTQLSGLNPYNGLRMDWSAVGWEEGAWSFPTVGVWRIYHASGTGTSLYYTQLTGTVNVNDDHASAKFTNAAAAEDLVMDFGTLGIWLYKQDGSGWVQISSMSPNRVKEVKFVGGDDYELLVEDLDTGYLHWGNWNGSGFTWTQITTAAQGPGWCETCDWDGIAAGESEEVFIPINTGGMYRYDFDSDTLTSVLNTIYKVNFAVRGDPYGVGYDSTLALAMTSTTGSPGLYLFDDAHGYERISSLVPDGYY